MDEERDYIASIRMYLIGLAVFYCGVQVYALLYALRMATLPPPIGALFLGPALETALWTTAHGDKYDSSKLRTLVPRVVVFGALYAVPILTAQAGRHTSWLIGLSLVVFLALAGRFVYCIKQSARDSRSFLKTGRLSR